MGFLSTLLTGGVLIGKVSKALTKIFQSVYTDEETGYLVAVSELSVAGVKFMQSNTSNDGMKCYAVNTNTAYDVSVVFPNDESGNGVAYDVPAGLRMNITGDLSAGHAPDKEILIGPSGESKAAATAGAVRRPVMKLSLADMKVGGEGVSVSDYKISCTETGLRVESGTRQLGDLVYLNLVSNKGVSLNCQCPVEAERSDSDACEYPFELAAGGLKKGDVLSGQLHIEMSGDALSSAHSSAQAEPLHPAELRCLRKLGIVIGQDAEQEEA